MPTVFSNFFTATPKNVDRAIAIGITFLTLSTAVVLSRSSSVQITRDGLNIQRDLIEVQSQRDQAVTVIKVCQQGMEQISEETKDFTRHYPVGQEILEDVEEAQEFVKAAQPDQLLREIEGEQLY